MCCNSSYFYIKPQLIKIFGNNKKVVIHPISTSNHNFWCWSKRVREVVIHPISTSNHILVVMLRVSQPSCNSSYFYIKPQLTVFMTIGIVSCNSSYFYIKPQLLQSMRERDQVVIHPISTSNHNRPR